MVKRIEGRSLKIETGERDRIVEDIARLSAYGRSRDQKYNRNLNRYINTGRYLGRADIWNPDNFVLGYNPIAFDNADAQTRLNVIKSAIDTVVSKLSQAKVRPYFNSVRGDYKTIKACRAAQDRFDILFDKLNVYQKAPSVARGALLFDAGHFWVDEDSEAIEPVPHWSVCVDPFEYGLGGMKSCTYGMINWGQYPLSLAIEQFGEGEWSEGCGNPRAARKDLVIFYDLSRGFKYWILGQSVVRKKAIKYKRLPITEMWWTPPIVGASSTCLADDLYSIQVEIDELQVRVDQAIRQSPFNTVYVPSGSDTKTTMLTNEAGAIAEYMPGPEGGMPVVATPAPISPQYLDMLQLYMRTAYELAGISQLSAQAKKPTGLDSGVALQTLEDVESERHNVTVNAYIHQFIDLASVVIDTFENDVVPASLSRSSVSWAEIRRQRELFNIQFSAGSALAKDPATKIEQIQQLQGLGIDLGPMLPQLLEIPDIETAYSASTAGYDYVQATIERAAETGDIDFMAIAPLDMFFSETVRWIMRLAADERNTKYLNNLKRLLDEISRQQDSAAVAMDSLQTSMVGMAPPEGAMNE